jgi:hypothetical protein
MLFDLKGEQTEQCSQSFYYKLFLQFGQKLLCLKSVSFNELLKYITHFLFAQ